MSAEHRGGRIVIEISDDGAGINSERVLQEGARTRAGRSPMPTLSEEEINNLIFLPGFSTAEKVSDISGRGVGMDVVRRNIQDVGGRISLKSDRGRGMTIQLALPLTLAVMDGMVIRVGQETYVMPMSAIVECLRPPASDIHNLIGTPGMLKLRGNLVPLVQLCDLLDIGVDGGGLATNGSSSSPMPARAPASASSSTNCAGTSKSSSRASRRATARFPGSPAPRFSATAASRSFSTLKNCPTLPAVRIFKPALRDLRTATPSCRHGELKVMQRVLPAGQMRVGSVIRSDDNASRSSP